MATIDFTKPVTTDLYTAWPTEIQANFNALALGLDPTYVTSYNGLIAGAKRINGTSGFIETYNGTAWVQLGMKYLTTDGSGTGVTTGSLLLANNIPLNWKDAGGTSRRMVLFSSAAMYFGDIDNGVTGSVNIYRANASHEFDVNGSAVMYLSPSGMGLGTTVSGSYRLSIGATANGILVTSPSGSPQLTVTDGNVTVYAGYTSGSGTTAVGYYGTASAHAQAFLTGNAERMRITSGGAFGWNQSPTVTYDFKGAGDMLRLGSGSGNNIIQAYSSGGTLGMWAGGSSQIYSNGPLSFLVGATTGTSAPTGGVTGLYIDSSGNALFGTNTALASAAGRGDVEVSGSSSAVYALNVGGVQAAYLYHSGSGLQLSSNTGFLALSIGGINCVQVATGGNTTFSYAAATTPKALTTTATTITLNCILSNVLTATLTGNVAAAGWTISNAQDGQTLNIFLTQDSTGSRTVAWPSSFKWPGGIAGTVSTAANAVDLLCLTYRASTGFFYATLAKGFA